MEAHKKNKHDRQSPVGICGMPWGIAGRGKSKLEVLWRRSWVILKGSRSQCSWNNVSEGRNTGNK